MHPAYSVIVFTTASGAGYGVLLWLAAARISGASQLHSPTFLLAAFGLAFALVTAGLVSSTLHLGRPERAWRALSQWRTSWLSREGVTALLTYPIAGLFGLACWFLNPGSPWTLMLALWTGVACLVTLWCTGMIYASLPTVRAWHMGLVAVLYVVLGVATGGILFNVASLLVGPVPLTRWTVAWELLALAAGCALKEHYWWTIDSARRTHTIGSATGLGRFGQVRALEPAHSRPNFVMREMGFAIARKHARQLRLLTLFGLFVIPAICAMLMLAPNQPLAVGAGILGVLSATVGILTERWLFFAEAEHVSMLYYGREAA